VKFTTYSTLLVKLIVKSDYRADMAFFFTTWIIKIVSVALVTASNSIPTSEHLILSSYIGTLTRLTDVNTHISDLSGSRTVTNYADY
jgi:hypothetical protein